MIVKSNPPSESTVDADEVRRELRERLQERRDILDDLEPRANPTLDPIAHQTATSTRRIIDEISTALERLDAGTYGRCVGCGEFIAPQRLEVIPYAAACVECQSHAEAT